MQLILRAVRCPAGISIVSSSFGPEGGDIGRSPDCTLALPDTHRFISRVHAEIRQKSGSFFLKVLSKVNPVVVNGDPVGFNQMVELNAGDQVTLGDYSFVAEISQGETAPRNEFGLTDPFALFDGLQQTEQAAGSGLKQDPFFQEKPSAPSSDRVGREANPGGDLADLLQSQPQAGSDPLLSILQGGDARPGGKPGKKSSGTGMGPTVKSPSLAPSVDSSAVDQFLGGGREGLVQVISQLSDTTLPGSQSRASQADHVHDINLPFNPPARKKSAAEVPPVAAFPPPPSVETPDAFEGDIFDALLGSLSNPSSPRSTSPTSASPPPAKAPASFADDLFSVLDGLIEPQQAAAVAPKPVPVESIGLGPSPVQVASESSSSEALIAKLAEGLNMPGLRVPPSDAPAFMLELGRMFRIAVEGVQALLLLRAEIKKELRAEDRTMIASRENNPLKHTESIEEALQYLLAFGVSNPAFLPPARAMEDAFKDMRAHEMAVMAGMRAGLSGVLKRFDPKSLEPRIKKTGALDSVLPTLYKAKLWDCYIEFYKDIEGEAEDHFDKLFGREFVRAYMEQSKQLSKRGKK